MTQRPRLLVLALALAASAGLALPAPVGAWEPRVPETFFGVSAPQLWSLTAQGRDSERDAQLDAMKGAGIDWVRVELGWPELEPTAPTGTGHNYRWAAADRLLSALASRRLELLAMPMAAPAWAASAASCGRRSGVAQARIADYAAFVEAVMRRYGRGGSFWAANPALPKVPIKRVEIWNEPNWNGFWCPEPDPEIFASLVRSAAERIHAVDPEAQAMIGGIAALQDSRHEGQTLKGVAADEFVWRAVVREPKLLQAIDAVGYHPYDVDPQVNLALIGWFRRLLSDLGFSGTQIALTEFGWHGGSPSLLGALSDAVRAANYTAFAGAVPRTNCGVSAVAAHTWKTLEQNLFDPEHWYGLVSALTGLLTSAGQAYREQVALFEGRGPTPAPRALLKICADDPAPDQDGDGVPDHLDDYPLDPTRWSGSGEQPPPAPEVAAQESRPWVPRVPDTFFGATLVRLPSDFLRLGEEFAAVAGARIGHLRMRVAWAWIEPVAPSHPDYARLSRWSWLDRVVLKMAAQGIRFLPAFGNRPEWAAAGGSAFDSAYVAFMRRIAARYGRGGSFWRENGQLDGGRLAVRDYEVWQFANHADQTPDGTASASTYAATYLATRAALRAVDPAARAVASIGDRGMGGAGSFLTAMAAADPRIRGALDAAHVWGQHARTWTEIDELVREARVALQASGNPAAPIYLGFGAPVRGPDAISESARAELIAAVASRAALGDCGVEGIFAHAWTTPEQSTSDSWHWFGIADPTNASLRATGAAYRDVATGFLGYGRQPPPTGAVHLCGSAGELDREGALRIRIVRTSAAPGLRSLSFAISGRGTSGAVRLRCRLDDRPWARCRSPHRIRGLGPGRHRLSVRARASNGKRASRTVRWRTRQAGR